MRKITFLGILFFLIISVSCFAIDYWWLDVRVENSMQRAYFFRDLRTMEQAIGIPPTVPGGPDLYQWWVAGSLGNVDPYSRTIRQTMQREGLGAAFVFYQYDRRMGYTYILYLRRNGTDYMDFYYTNSPIKFPE